MSIWERIKNFFSRNKNDLPKLEEANLEVKPEVENNFVKDNYSTVKDPEEIAMEQKEKALRAAYMCLARKALGYEKEFNEEDYLGSSLQKSKIMLQAEETFKEYGYGKEFPEEITEDVVKVFQILGRNFSELKSNETFYGHSNPLEDFMNKNNLNISDLENIVLENGEKLSENVIKKFKSNNKGISFVSFNLDYEAAKARTLMDEAIEESLDDISKENSLNK